MRVLIQSALNPIAQEQREDNWQNHTGDKQGDDEQGLG